MILGVLHARGFLNEDAKQHALKEHSKIVNKMTKSDAFDAVSRILESVSVMVLVGNVCQVSGGAVSQWCQSVVSVGGESVLSVSSVSRSCQSVVSVDAVSRCCESVFSASVS